MFFFKRRRQRSQQGLNPIRLFFGLAFLLLLIPIAYTVITRPDATEAAIWNFDEGYGSTVTDGSATNYAADINGPAWKSEDFCLEGKCLYFDGSDDYVATTSTTIFDAGAAYTIMFWVKPTFGGESNTETVIAKAGVVQINLEDTTDNVVVSYPGNGTAASSHANTIATNQWHHIAVTHNGSGTIAIYINGIDQTDDSTVTDINSNAVVVFGSETNGTTSQSFQGFLDSVKILTSQLTSSQIIGHALPDSYTDRGAAVTFGSLSQRVLSHGLVGYWMLNETSGNALDGSGNNATLTDVNTVTRVGGYFGNAGDFELSASEYLYTADTAPLSITGSLTISAWIKPETVSAGLYNIVAKWDGITESYRLAQSGDEIRLEIDSSGNYQQTISADLQVGTFYHVVGVYDASAATIQIYINGTEASSSTTGTIPSSIGDDNSRFHIGAEDSTLGANNFYDGVIDEVRVYNKALTSGDILALYSKVPGPLAYYPLNENAGTTTVNDISGNGLNGSMDGSMPESAWVKGMFGSALAFDGVDDKITVADTNTLDIISPVTISGWVNAAAAGTAAPSPLFSDGFESNNFTAWDTGGETTATRTTGTTYAKNGTYGVQYAVNTGAQNAYTAYVQDNFTFPASNKIYLKTWLNLASVSNFPNLNVAGGKAVMGVFDNSGNRIAWLVFDDSSSGGGNPGLRLAARIKAGSDVFVGNWAAISTATWYEVTMMVDKSGSEPTVEWWLDGVSQVSASDPTSGTDGLGRTPARAQFGILQINNWADGVYTFYQDDSAVYDTDPTTAATNATLIGKGRDAYQLEMNSSGSVIGYVNSTSVTATSTLNAWHHVSLTYDGANIRLYIDGVLKTTQAATGAVGTNATNLTIGHLLRGTIDDIKVYNYARSATQVVEDMNGNHPVGGSRIGSQLFYLKLDEQSGQVAHSQENIYNFQLGSTSGADTNDPTWATGTNCKVNTCLDFSTNDYLVIDDNSNLEPPDDMTLTGWIYFDTLPGASDAKIIYKQHSVSPWVSYEVMYDETTQKIMFQWVNTSGTYYAAETADTVTTSTWYHFAAVKSGNTIQIYLDGKGGNAAATTGTLYNSDRPLYIGSNNGNTPVDGRIDELKMYAAGLTASEVLIDMNSNAAIKISGDQSEASLNTSGEATPFLWYKMDENDGQTVYDSSGNGYDGILGLNTTSEVYDPTWTVGKIGSALSFDNSNDFITVGNLSILNLTDSEDLTISGWVQRHSYATDDIIFAKKATSAATDSGYMVWIDDASDTITFAISDGTDQYVIRSNVTILNRDWYHFIVVWDQDSATNSTIYINGIDSRGTPSGTISLVNGVSNALEARIGIYPGGTTLPFHGLMDNIKFFKAALTPDQAAYEFNRGLPVGHWKMDEASWTNNCSTDTVFDSSGNNNHGDACPNSTGPTGGATGKFNNAGEFDGSNDYVIVPDSNSLDITSSFSLSAWINPDTLPSSSHSLRNIVQKTGDGDLDTAGTQTNYALMLKNGFVGSGQGIFCGFENTAHADFPAYADITLATGQWHMVSCVFDDVANTIIIYVNGKVQTVTSSITGVPAAQAQPVIIGGEDPSAPFSIGEYFDGKIDDVRIYDYALSTAQLEKIYNENAAVKF